MQTTYEINGRRAKAEKLAAAIRQREGTPDEARRLTDMGWLVVSQWAGIKRTPSPETREMVVQILGE